MSFKTVKETAEIFNVCERTIFRMIERGELISNKIGYSVRISEEEIDRVMKESKQQ